ncbi:MAG: DUF1569 domain-containing protein [Chitinophagaceae bacterium]|nr:DUF1569 domain-containing protein [Chitinophagaceae bacterium]
MKNLFDQATADEFISRIERLQQTSTPRWGKMNAVQMLAHCQAPFRVCFGELQLKQSLIGKIFGPMAKRKLLSAKPFGKNLPTAKEFIVPDRKDFEEEKNSLIQQIRRFSLGGHEVVKNFQHPFFGKMTPDEWGALSAKHLDHHLQQFGV